MCGKVVVGGGGTGRGVGAMLADCIEYGEYKTNVRNEGMVYSASSMGGKIGAGIGAALLGFVLEFGKFDAKLEVQPDSSLNAITTCFIWLPLLFITLQLVVLLFYKLDKEYPEVIAELERRKK